MKDKHTRGWKKMLLEFATENKIIHKAKNSAKNENK